MRKEFDKELYKELILYISERCQDKPTFGSTHLNKILHYADFFWYAATGDSISGERYIRQKHGQIPKHLMQVRDELVKEGKLAIDEQQYFGKTQKRPVVVPPVSYWKLTGEQKEFIDEVIAAVADYSARDLSEKIAHEDLAWQYLNNDEEIPYETVFFRRKNAVAEETLAWAQSVVDDYEASLIKAESNV